MTNSYVTNRVKLTTEKLANDPHATLSRHPRSNASAVKVQSAIFSVLQGHGSLSTLCTRTTVRGTHVEGGQASRHTSIHMSVCVCTKQSRLFSPRNFPTLSMLCFCDASRRTCVPASWRHFSWTVDKSLDRTSGLSCKISTRGKRMRTGKRASDISWLTFGRVLIIHYTY